MTRTLTCLFALAALFCTLMACTTQAPQPRPEAGGENKPVAPTDTPKPVADKPEPLPDHVQQAIRDAAVTYSKLEKVGDLPAWAMALCRPNMPTDFVPIASASKDDDTHGRKLYYLWIKDTRAWYDARDKADAQPLGQVIVKESFKPEAADANDRHAIKHNDKHVKAGERYALFLMLKFAPDTKGTDQGWVYATASADGKTITGQGRIESCMSCHEDAKHDRVFGPKVEK